MLWGVLRHKSVANPRTGRRSQSPTVTGGTYRKTETEELSKDWESKSRELETGICSHSREWLEKWKIYVGELLHRQNRGMFATSRRSRSCSSWSTWTDFTLHRTASVQWFLSSEMIIPACISPVYSEKGGVITLPVCFTDQRRFNEDMSESGVNPVWIQCKATEVKLAGW